MSNAINRQESAEYEYDVNRWRKAVDGHQRQVNDYNSRVTTYNKQLDAYKASANNVQVVTGRNQYRTETRYSAPPPDQSLIANKPTALDESQRPVPPSFTQQQLADMNKSDQPMADAAMNEQGKRSAFGALPGRDGGETGLIARALKGFK